MSMLCNQVLWVPDTMCQHPTHFIQCQGWSYRFHPIYNLALGNLVPKFWLRPELFTQKKFPENFKN
jgi:hypothetical protein